MGDLLPKKKLSNDARRGVAVTELAVCLPILVLIVFATLETCSNIYLKQTLSVAAYEGARVALINGATAVNVDTQCQQILNDRGVTNATIQITPANFEAMPVGTFVAVYVSAPCRDNLVTPVVIFSPAEMSARVEMMKEF